MEAAVAPAVVLSCSTPSHSSSCCQMTGAGIGHTAALGLQVSHCPHNVREVVAASAAWTSPSILVCSFRDCSALSSSFCINSLSLPTFLGLLVAAAAFEVSAFCGTQTSLSSSSSSSSSIREQEALRLLSVGD